MIDWINKWDIIEKWQWDLWHIACTLFIILVLITARWIYMDSVRINKEKKKAGAKSNVKMKVNGKQRKDQTT